MPRHSDVTHYGAGVSGTQLDGANRKGAICRIKCSLCGESAVGAVVAETVDPPKVVWIRCTTCDRGLVSNDGALAPSLKMGEDIEGLPSDVAEAHDEARRAAGVEAYTSCELTCRKILMHIAVDKGDAEGKSFVAYLDFLKGSGYVTPPMMPWVDLIRSHGNLSTHRLEMATRKRALSTLAFTAQLLRLVYEMEHKASMFVTPAGPTS
jgi:hypothetical protein